MVPALKLGQKQSLFHFYFVFLRNCICPQKLSNANKFGALLSSAVKEHVILGMAGMPLSNR